VLQQPSPINSTSQTLCNYAIRISTTKSPTEEDTQPLQHREEIRVERRNLAQMHNAQGCAKVVGGPANRRVPPSPVSLLPWPRNPLALSLLSVLSFWPALVADQLQRLSCLKFISGLGCSRITALLARSTGLNLYRASLKDRAQDGE
jgi:hypothetical protein